MNKQKKTNRGVIKGASLEALIFDLLNAFPEKNQEIIKRRFGLAGPGQETLEAIGKDYGITRERVRQIEAATLKTLRSGVYMRKLAPVENALAKVLASTGGLAAERALLKEALGTDYKNRIYRNLVLFVLHLSDKFFDFSESEQYNRAWTLKKGFFKVAEEIIDAAHIILESQKEPVTFKTLYQAIEKSPVPTANLSPAMIHNYLLVSKEVVANRFKDWGLASWSQINPRGVKDRAYIILKKENRPLHFREITDLINQSKLSKKAAHAPTVHNELIKDPRFVLVGRGIYALRDWGFREGTVKDVIVEILKKVKKPLPRESLLQMILAQRLVRRSTILLNLQDSKIFTRNQRDEISLKKR